MQRKKCFATLGVLRRKVLGYGRRGVALAVVIAALTLASGAAGFQLDGGPDAAGTYNILHRFTWAQYPSGNLIFDTAGNLYGTTQGGAKCCGAVWKLARNPKGTWTVNILHAFTGGAGGAYPYAGVIFDGAGNLYGTTADGGASGASCAYRSYGCGTVFKLTPNPDGSWTESVLYSFCSEYGCADGARPFAGLVLDAEGNLYGTTYGGGDGHGVVFELLPNPDGTWTESVLHSFAGADGRRPFAGLVLDAEGNLYGTTADGGVYDAGVVLKLAPTPDGTWTESVLHSFTFPGADGAASVAGLIFDAAGNLYGTTEEGGSTACYGGCGVVFELSPSSSGWSETVLHTFIGFGKYPEGGVIFDPAGNLYGTAWDGNHAFDYGLVFEITR
jgi:hypothetical protein